MYDLDKVDREILKQLQKDSSITIKELSKILNLTTTPVHERIKRLEKDRVIKSYVALVDARKIDKKLIVFISISLKNHSRSYLEKFVSEVGNFPEVTECYHIAGNFDYLLKVQLKDMEAYQQFILSKLSVNNNIDQVQSSFVLSRDKFSTALPV